MPKRDDKAAGGGATPPRPAAGAADEASDASRDESSAARSSDEARKSRDGKPDEPEKLGEPERSSSEKSGEDEKPDGAEKSGRATKPGKDGKPAQPDKRSGGKRRAADHRAGRGSTGKHPGGAFGRPGTNRRGIGASVLCLILVAALVFVVLFGIGAYHRHHDNTGKERAVAAAKQTVVNFVTISAKTVNSDLKRVSQGSTGQFKDQFSQSTSQLKSLITRNNVVSTGRVLATGVVNYKPTTAKVLLVVDSTVRNKSYPKGQVRHYRIKVTMSKTNDVWRVGVLQFIG